MPLTDLADVPRHESKDISRRHARPEQGHDGMDAIRGVLVVFEEGPRVAGMVDVVLEVGGEGPEGGRNVADEVEFVHL